MCVCGGGGGGGGGWGGGGGGGWGGALMLIVVIKSCHTVMHGMCKTELWPHLIFFFFWGGGGGNLFFIYLFLIKPCGFGDVAHFLLWNFTFKFHLHAVCGHGQKPINFHWCRFQKWPPNGYFGLCSFWCLTLKSALNIQLPTLIVHYLCVWVEANWFSVMLLSKWPPSYHIGFFGFLLRH